MATGLSLGNAISFPVGPIIDASTGQISIEWFMWFQNINNLVQSLKVTPSSSSGSVVCLSGMDESESEEGTYMMRPNQFYWF